MISPHGNALINCFVDELSKSPVVTQTHQSQEIDIYNIASGAYSPIQGFARKQDFDSVLEKMQLSDGTLWSIPIIFCLSEETQRTLETNQSSILELHDASGNHYASLKNIEIYPFDKTTFCQSVYGTIDKAHPGIERVNKMPNFLVGGDLEVKTGWKVVFDDVEAQHILSPEETRTVFAEKGFTNIVAFQTRNVPHRGHEYIQKCALENVDALLVHPVIGEKKSGDFHNRVIIGSYDILAKKYYNPERVIISCLPWVMQYAGPKEAILHAIIRQNFGCSHFIVGRDHAGVGSYYGTYDAQKIFDTIPKGALEIHILRYENAAYCPQVQGVVTDKTSPSPQAERIFISGTKFRTMLLEGQRPPVEFIRPEITDYLLGEKDIFIE